MTISFLYCKECKDTDINDDDWLCNGCRSSEDVVNGYVEEEHITFE